MTDRNRGRHLGGDKAHEDSRLRRTCDGIHEFSELEVPRGQAATVVRAQKHVHLVVDIEPFRMMVHLLRNKSNSAHKSPGLVEVLEEKLLLDGIAPGCKLPTCNISDEVL